MNLYPNIYSQKFLLQLVMNFYFSFLNDDDCFLYCFPPFVFFGWYGFGLLFEFSVPSYLFVFLFFIWCHYHLSVCIIYYVVLLGICVSLLIDFHLFNCLHQ